MKRPNPKTLEALRSSLAAAAAGNLAWLDTLVLEAGYLRNPENLSARAVASLFGVTPQAVGLWHKKESCPRNDDNTYDLRAVLRWYTRRLRQDSNTDLPAGFRDWKNYYSAQLSRLEYEQAVGELIPRDEVENGRRARLIALTRGLENMGSALAGRLGGRSPAEIQAAIDEYIRHLRAEFAGVDLEANPA